MQTAAERKAALSESTLRNFSGTGAYHRLGFPLKKSVITDGVKHVADNGVAWHVTDTAVAVEYSAKVPRDEGMLFTALTSNGKGGATLTIDDGDKGNGKVVFYTQEYEFVDFPGLEDYGREGFRMFVAKQPTEDGKEFYVFMLPSEY